MTQEQVNRLNEKQLHLLNNVVENLAVLYGADISSPSPSPTPTSEKTEEKKEDTNIFADAKIYQNGLLLCDAQKQQLETKFGSSLPDNYGIQLGDAVDMAVSYKKEQGIPLYKDGQRGAETPLIKYAYGDEFDPLVKKHVMLTDLDVLTLVLEHPITFKKRIAIVNAKVDEIMLSGTPAQKKKYSYKNFRMAVDSWGFDALDKEESRAIWEYRNKNRI